MRMLTKAILVAGIIVVGATLAGFVIPPHTNKSETYIVKQGDTLWDIAGVYLQKNTYAPRDQREFMHGIIEHNYDRLFVHRVTSHDRSGTTIYPGDEIEIVWQERIEEE